MPNKHDVWFITEGQVGFPPSAVDLRSRIGWETLRW